MKPDERTIDGKTYWSTGKASQYIGVCTNTMRSMAQKKMVTHIRIGKQLLFTKEWLDSYINRATIIGNGNGR